MQKGRPRYEEIIDDLSVCIGVILPVWLRRFSETIEQTLTWSGSDYASMEIIRYGQEEDRILMEPCYQYYLDWYHLVFQKAVQCLESGEKIFFCVDLDACLTDEIGLVDRLRAAGYTVEQVRYTQ